MLKTWLKTALTKTTAVCMALMLTLPVFLHEPKPAEAQSADPVFVVGSAAPSDLKTAVASAQSAALDIFTAGGIEYLVFKEKVLDPLAWNLVNSTLTGMLQSLTLWVNSGFQGDPAFVTDVEGFLRNEIDKAAGEFLADQGLDFLCSPSKLDVKIALNKAYAQSRQPLGAANNPSTQCSLEDMTDNVESFLSGNFAAGGWGSWFELTQGAFNDPNKAYAENLVRLSVITQNAKQEEFDILKTNNFFLNKEVCETIQTAGGPKQSCQVSTWGKIIEDQLNSTFDAQRKRLAMADEFDELMSALVAQLANQAVTGLNGLLGMGGTRFSDNTYGPSGNQSFLEAAAAESQQLTASNLAANSPVGNSIEQIQDYQLLNAEIVFMVEGAEAKLEAAKSQYGSCILTKMPANLTDMKETATDEIIRTAMLVEILGNIDERFTTATNTIDRLNIMEEFQQLESEGAISIEIDSIQLEIDISDVLPAAIANFEAKLEDDIAQCTNLLTS